MVLNRPLITFIICMAILCMAVFVCSQPALAGNPTTTIVQTSSDNPDITTIVIIESTPTPAPTASAEYWAAVREAHQEHWEATAPKNPSPIIGVIAGLGIVALFALRKK